MCSEVVANFSNYVSFLFTQIKIETTLDINLRLLAFDLFLIPITQI